MIVSGLDSGMGNQMFQYAVGFALARERNDKFCIDISQFKYNQRPYALDCFNISADIFHTSSAHSNTKFFRMLARMERLMRMGIFSTVFYKEKPEWHYKYHDFNDVKSAKSVYLSGFWQNYRYFDGFRDEIRKEFSIKEDVIGDYAKKLIERVSGVESIAIHIRRGDYLVCDGWLIDENYYRTALEEVLKQIDRKKAKIYLFCEDKEYAEKLFEGIPYELVTCQTKLSDIEEFWVMRNCKHFVVANSTFSWWAAYLGNDAGSIVYAPVFKQWTEEFYPENWNTIKA